MVDKVLVTEANSGIIRVDKRAPHVYNQGMNDDKSQTPERRETPWQPTTAEQPIKPQALRPLTRKQTAFIKQIIENPKQSTTAAVKQVYNVTTDNSASQIATDNLRNPKILAELAKHTGRAELVIMEVMEQSRKEMYSGSKEAVAWAVNARQTADSLLDRVGGKATIKQEITSQAVTLNIDLTGAVEDTTA